MANNFNHNSAKNYLIQLNYIYFLLLLLAISCVQVGALYLQIFYHEIPCPLCLLQRVAYFGICFGILINLRHHYSLRFEGLIQFISLILLVISTRQTLLDIYPRPGHEYIGSTILGLHMPVWSIVISVLLLFTYTIKFCIFGYTAYMENTSIYFYPHLKFIFNVLMWFIILLCLFNLLLVILQCGFHACHTEEYRLLTSIT